MNSKTKGQKVSAEIRGGSTVTYTSRPLPKPAPQSPGKNK